MNRKALLISTYEMGRQPFGLASPAAWLKSAGWEVVCVDTAKEPLDEAIVASAHVVGIHLPMHTATRLAAPVIQTVRHANPTARICAYGLYAPLNEAWLRALGVDRVIGGEFEADLVAFARAAGDRRPLARESSGSSTDGRSPLPRLKFLVPDRGGLLPLARYATLQMQNGSRRLVGYTEATRGCKHLCRHCPVVPIYEGQFRVVQPEVVLADIDAQVASGAEHVTFGDPDFFNGPAHAMRIVDAMHRRHATVSYDVTIKIEHLLAHRELLPRLVETGCAFVTSAVESVDDRVLAILEKGHTRSGFMHATRLCRDAGLPLVPTFVTFHPWLTIEGYCDLLDTVARLGLVEHVAPIQLAIRLLVPEGSRLLTVPEMRRYLGTFDPSTLTHRWVHPDPRVDLLHRDVSAIAGARVTADRRLVFAEVSELAHERAGLAMIDTHPARDRSTVPYLNEPWYC
ncbi:MAG TPA: CUAEP/CCAEP-tail radical SAM protein [Vicinamibacterales bacterium]|nr:CUAEP/CCAEP-tail radical SAM protein [Vicinamibacterales bacterium]